MAYRHRWRQRREDDGAALVEFAILAPFLILLALGMVEAGWAFNAKLDVTHAAREAGRLAAVNTDTAANMVAEACSRMDLSNNTTIELTRTGAQIGDELAVDVIHNYTSITGGFIPFFNGITVNSTVEMRLEQDATWSGIAGPISC